MLPAGSRDRYLEEFSSELRELADARTGSHAQLRHALRLGGELVAADRVWDAAVR
jgi:hypothetical protein